MSKTAKMTLLIFCLFVLYKVFIQSDSKSFIRDKRKDSKFEFILSLFKKRQRLYYRYGLSDCKSDYGSS